MLGSLKFSQFQVDRRRACEVAIIHIREWISEGEREREEREIIYVG